MYLLDSSAIAITIKRLREKTVEALDGKITLDLSRYELGNMIWKECTLKGLISQEEALDRAADLAKILEFTNVERIESGEDFKGAMKLATDLKLTFYDASYLQIAKSKELILVTEDKELSEKAKKANIRTITVNELLRTPT
jgi:predicted nucleic acid-binding protein